MHAPEASFFHSVLIICIVLGCIISFFIVSMVKQHRRNVALYKSQIAAEITTMEKERARISADLHDDLGPMLSAIKFKVSSVETDAEDAAVLRDAEKYIDEVIQKLRIISNNLLPATLLRKGLVFALEEYIGQSEKGNKLLISFSHSKIPTLPADMSVNLYRIIQEIIHNAVKHSGATVMNINMEADEHQLVLTCADNGKGFEYHKADVNTTGLGLRNIWSRTELLKGEMFIDSAASKGTSYTIEIPLK